jgi:hypothetical protein
MASLFSRLTPLSFLIRGFGEDAVRSIVSVVPLVLALAIDAFLLSPLAVPLLRWGNTWVVNIMMMEAVFLESKSETADV